IPAPSRADEVRRGTNLVSSSSFTFAIAVREASAFCGGLFHLRPGGRDQWQARLGADGRYVTMSLGIQLTEIKHVLLGDRWHEVEHESFVLDTYEFMDGNQAVARGDGQLITTVRFAREQRLMIAVRGGGHSVAGFSTCDGGMVIDLSGMRSVQVDPARRTARVAGGALLEQLDQATQEYGLACPVGVVGHTGVGGLTLGGGMGRLERKHGYTIDNLLSIELVTAGGAVRRVSGEDDPELFWGLRGAGANFGVATAFEFGLHPIGPAVTSGAVVFPIGRARDAAALYRDFARSGPDHVHLGLNFATGPAGRGGPHEMRGATVAITATHFGDQKDAERDLVRLRSELEPLADTFARTTYLAVQSQS